MALEAVVFPQDHPFHHYAFPEIGEEDMRVFNGVHGSWEPSWPFTVHEHEDLDVGSLLPEPCMRGGGGGEGGEEEEEVATGRQRRKRRRIRSPKSRAAVESQRMTHIAVERNRRKLMNEHLAVLRSLMPTNYVQRGDQASIIGAAINFVKEIEQLHQWLEAQKSIKQRSNAPPNGVSSSSSSFSSFGGFFTSPQYTPSSSCSSNTNASATSDAATITDAFIAERRSSVADIEATMVDSHANLKILSNRRPKQLPKLVVGLQNLQLTTLHLNVTTVEQLVLYTFNLKIEEECQCKSVDEIATAVYQLVEKIALEAALH